MQILRISTRIYPDIGGPAKQVYLLSNFCSKNNIKTINIACRPDSVSDLKKKINQNLEINYLPFQAPGINSGIIKQAFFFFRFIIHGLFKAIKIKKRFKIDLIHSYAPTPSGIIALILSKIFKIPFVYSIHGLDYPNRFVLNFDIKFIINNSKMTIVVSKKIKNFLLNNFKLKNVYQFPNAIDSSEYYHTSTDDQKDSLIRKLQLDSFLNRDDRIIIYIGYMIFLQKVNGMIDFLFAFKNFLTNLKDREKVQKYKVLFIGKGKFANLLIKKIKEFNLDQNVIFLGKRNDIKELLAISDLLALTSYIEGSPNVLLEAMASNIPCLGTNVGEIKNMIGKSGYVVNPGDIENIRKSLEDFFNLTEIQKSEMRKGAKTQITNKFDINVVGRKLIKLYLK